jgi:hypothetical protein
MYNVKFPILFLIFNRPDETKRVFSEIAKVQPKKLYIAADGPRFNKNEEDLCVMTKKIFDQIDWECEIKTLYRTENLGCKMAVHGAITWFFNNEECGIILEDDCLPSIDFFRFCDDLLIKYKDDFRIGHIAGSNLQNGIKRNENDYYFSKLTHVWGWASWRRVWENYDLEMKSLDHAISNDFLNVLTNKWIYKKVYYNILYKTQKNKIDTWDYQYFYSNIINSYLSIIPNYNLISNIGYGEGATHTTKKNSFSDLNIDKFPTDINHPNFFFQNIEADNYTLKKTINLNLKVFLILLKDFFKQ